MRKSLFSLLVLASLGPTLAVPATLWHHHADAAVLGECKHPCAAADDHSTAPSHDEPDTACPVCTFCKLINVELPTTTITVVEARPAIPTIPPAMRVAVNTTPFTIDARGPPATATVA